MLKITVQAGAPFVPFAQQSSSSRLSHKDPRASTLEQQSQAGSACRPFKLLKSSASPRTPHEVQVDGSTVVWSCHGVLKKTVSLHGHGPIVDVVFARFALGWPGSGGDCGDCSSRSRNSNIQEALVIVARGAIRYFFDSGEQFEAKAVFVARSVWPLSPVGLLLERDVDVIAPAAGPPSNAATLFTISHPLDEPRAVWMQADPAPSQAPAPSVPGQAHQQQVPAAGALLGSFSTTDPRLRSVIVSPQQGRLVHVSTDADGARPFLVLHNPQSGILAVKWLSNRTADNTDGPNGSQSSRRTTPVSSSMSHDKWQSPALHTPELLQPKTPTWINECVSPYTIVAERRVQSTLYLMPGWSTRLPFNAHLDTCFVAHDLHGVPVLWVASRSRQTAIAFYLSAKGDDERVVGQWAALGAAPPLLPCGLPDNLHGQLGVATSSFKRRRTSSDEPGEWLSSGHATCHALSGAEQDKAQAVVDSASRAPLHASHLASSLGCRSPSKSRRDEVLRSPSRESRVVDISDPFGSQVIMHLSTGMMFVACFKAYASSTLVRSGLDAVASVLKPDVYIRFHHDFLVARHSLPSPTAATPILSYATAHPDEELTNAPSAEWNGFVSALLHSLSSQQSAPIRTSMRQPPKPEASSASLHLGDLSASQDQDDLWTWFLHSSDCRSMQVSLPIPVLDALLPNGPSGGVQHVAKLQGETSQRQRRDIDQPSKSDPAPILGAILVVLHAVYEDFKLCTALSQQARTLAQFLARLSVSLGFHSYADHYLRDGVVAMDGLPLVGKAASARPACEPVDVYDWVRDRVSHRMQDDRGVLGTIVDSGIVLFPQQLALACPRLRVLTKLYNALVTHTGTTDRHIGHAAKGSCKPPALLRVMSSLALSQHDLDSLPVGISLPIREALHDIRSSNSCDGLDAHQLRLVNRMDIAEQRFGQHHHVQQPQLSFADSRRLPSNVEAIHQAILDGKDADMLIHGEPEDDDDAIVSLLFRHDARIATVSKLLLPTEPPQLDLPLHADMGDDAISAEQQQILQRLACRTWSLATKVLPTETLHVPDVTIAARLPPVNSLLPPLHLQTQQQHMHQTQLPFGSPATALEWAEFHAGVAAGLQVQNNSAYASAGNTNAATAKHSGGHLSRKELITMAVMLGKSQLMSLLSLHIDTNLPDSSGELGKNPVLRAVATASSGLLFLGSHSRLRMANMMHNLQEIKLSHLDPENAANECFATSCGFGLGFLALPPPANTLSTSESRHKFADGLLRLLGGPDAELTAAAAATALTFAFLKSNDAIVAGKIAIPTPDLLFHRILAKTLIFCIPSRMRHGLLVRLSNRPLAGVDRRDATDVAMQVGDATRMDDNSLVWQAYFFMGAGACMAMALRFAGTCNPAALDCLLAFMDDCLAVSTKVITRTAARSALNVICTSLGRLKALHGKLAVEFGYGCHMAVGMATGLLFLGRGTLTLGTSNLAVATSALRHLWVLAVEKRCTRQPVAVPIRVPRVLELFTPLCGPPRESLIRNLWVQRKAGHLSYADDPDGHNSILLMAAPQTLPATRQTARKPSEMPVDDAVLRSFSADPQILAFLRYFCKPQGPAREDSLAVDMSAFCMQVLFECLTADKLDMIQTHLWLYETMRKVDQGSGALTGIDARNLDLIVAHYDSLSRQALQLAVASGMASGGSVLDQTGGVVAEHGWQQQQPDMCSSLEACQASVRKIQASNLIPQQLVDIAKKRLEASIGCGFGMGGGVDGDSSNAAFAAVQEAMKCYLRSSCAFWTAEVSGLTPAQATLLGVCLVAKRVPKPPRLEQVRAFLTSALKHPVTPGDHLEPDESSVLLAFMSLPDCPQDVLRCMMQ
ncbi:hypothetical protein BC831DRAFT_441633 [Entophlyctis helioformis]|nr:hypothetical protein BC831DRAFT_441633 [Entophlyctis helioformis]